MNDGRRGHFQALVALLLANACWGLSFPLIKTIALTHQAVDGRAVGWFVTAMTVAPRFLLAALVLGAVLAWRRRAPHGSEAGFTRREWRQGLGLGGFAAAGMLLQNDGLQYTPASTSAFLTQLYAVLIPLWIMWRLRRRPGPVVWCAMALVVLGTAVLARLDPREFTVGRGEVETLFSSFFFAGQILLLSREDFMGNRPLAVTQVMFITEGVLFSLLALGLAPEASALLAPWHSPPWVGLTLLLTACCTLGAFLLMNTFQPRISATEAGLIYCIEPVFAALLALFLPAWFSLWAGIEYANEQLTVHLLLGGGLITLANLILQVKPPVAAK